MQLYRQGRSQRVTLGLVGELSLVDARTQAMALKAKGLKSTRGRRRDGYRSLGASSSPRTSTGCATRTKKLYLGYWTNHIEPAIGAKKLAKVTPSDVSTMLGKIPGNAHANRVHELTKRLFGYAVEHQVDDEQSGGELEATTRDAARELPRSGHAGEIVRSIADQRGWRRIAVRSAFWRPHRRGAVDALG